MSKTIIDPAGSRAFLGKGLALPFAVTPQGKLGTVKAEAKIEQSIWLIVSTGIGERVMRPTYGCGLHDMVFEPNNPSTVARIIDQVRRALVTQEPRVAVLDVTVETSPGQPNLLLIRVDYRIHENNAIANLVYPYFVTEGV